MNKIKIIITTHISDDTTGIREYEYRAVLSFLRNAYPKHEILIIDSKNNKGSFLEDYGFEVLYSDIKNEYKNKGCNEVDLLLKAEPYIDADFVIKLTGRYLPKSYEFIDAVKNELDNEVLCRLSGGYLWTGLFATKKNIFFDSIRSLDLQLLEKNYICLECALWEKLITKKM